MQLMSLARKKFIELIHIWLKSYTNLVTFYTERWLVIFIITHINFIFH